MHRSRSLPRVCRWAGLRNGADAGWNGADAGCAANAAAGVGAEVLAQPLSATGAATTAAASATTQCLEPSAPTSHRLHLEEVGVGVVEVVVPVRGDDRAPNQQYTPRFQKYAMWIFTTRMVGELQADASIGSNTGGETELMKEDAGRAVIRIARHQAFAVASAALRATTGDTGRGNHRLATLLTPTKSWCLSQARRSIALDGSWATARDGDFRL